MTDHVPFILIVEDQEALAEIVARVVGKLGAEAKICLTAEDAIDYLDNGRLPDLIILDIGMPGMSGWDFLDLIKRVEDTRSIPVLVATAHGDAANRVIGKLRDVDKYLIKPYKPEEIRDAVTEILQLSF
jgi:CheY-like chemotaxis protein